jgi:hypothetical protein
VSVTLVKNGKVSAVGAFAAKHRNETSHQFVHAFMTRYSFYISNGEAFNDAEEFPDDDAACQQAKTVRDIEASLWPNGGDWSIEVRRDDSPIFQIDVRVRRI